MPEEVVRLRQRPGRRASDRPRRPGAGRRHREREEELPNKLRDLLGIVAEIDLLEEDGKPYLRIAVEPYPVPIRYRGEYHYRTGSTKQVDMLKGAALDRFLLGKTGRRWDAAPMPGVAVEDLDSAVRAANAWVRMS